MPGNRPVQFLGEGVTETSPPYPTPGLVTTRGDPVLCVAEWLGLWKTVPLLLYFSTFNNRSTVWRPNVVSVRPGRYDGLERVAFVSAHAPSPAVDSGRI
jgi:hypothetical protein